MNDKKRSFRQKTEDFLSGRGFYIALSACVLVIGISAWTLLASGTLAGRTDVAEDTAATANVAEKSDIRETITVPMIDRTKEKSSENEPAPQPEPQQSQEEETLIEEAHEETIETMAPVDEVESAMAENFVWPVFGEIEVGYFADELVYNKTMMDWRTHSAIDIDAELGAKVLACASGTVTEVYNDALLGTIVVIDHGNGLESIYANLAATPTVSVGDEVTNISVIGAVGDTAIGETGQPYHLHFAMRQDGESIDPTEYLP